MTRRPARADRADLTGVLVVDKGPGVTSFGVVALLRDALRVSRVGHGGTLDPDATGVLPILLGEATKLAPYLMEHDKEYRATVQLGVTTDTQDLAGRVVDTRVVPAFTREEVEEAAGHFLGAIAQVPPMYSALHHGGERLYELARRGIEVERPPRTVVVHALDVEAVELPFVTLRIVCGKGTYVRTLAADLGERLGVGAAVARLVRTRVGGLALADAVPWADVVAGRREHLTSRLRPPDAVLTGFARVDLDAPSARRIRHGQSVDAPAVDGTIVRMYDSDGGFIGVGRAQGGRVKPERLLHADQPGTRVVPG